MEDIELVIKISEKDLQDIRKKVFTVEEMFETTQGRVYRAIVNGTPLPKGHGRLFDEQDIVNGNYEIIGNRIYELEPIIEAESETKNEKRRIPID